MKQRKVVIIGLDSMPPSLVFDVQRENMPTLSRLIDSGSHGPLRSTDPPITIPAWISMTSGLEPGDLGVYGFRQRTADSYGMRLVEPSDVSAPRLWDLVAANKKKAVVVSVPLTYPPSDNPLIAMTSCFLTPGPESMWASNSSVAQDLEERFGQYIVDVENFRSGDKHRILSDCSDMTKQHFAIFRYLIKKEQPDFAMIVDLGPDRLHHTMLSSCMPNHPKYSSNNPLNRAVSQYYALLDNEISEVLDLLDDDTLVLVVSDHGVKPLLGSVCINEWLYREGYLVLKEYPNEITPLSRCKVDWKQTRAFGEGGYHARIFLNINGREPMGAVPASSFSQVRNELANRLEQMTDSPGELLKNRVYTPDMLYENPVGFPPDLTVYFDDLSRRSAGTLGHRSVFIKTNDTGPDEANHDYNGIWIMADKKLTSQNVEIPADICDIFQTAIFAMGITRPVDTRGKSLF